MRVLHHYPLSPSSRMIRLYLEEKKIEFVTKLEIFWERNETFLKLNPSGEVPILVDQNNTVLCGSRIIVEYFEGGAQETLDVKWRGPGFEWREIPAFKLFQKSD